MTSAGLTCGCDNGYEDCGEAQHGWKSENSIRPGDCGGTSSCAACPIDCTNGVQDADEDGPDCGGACALDRFSVQPHECACFDSDCTDTRECNKPVCNPNIGGGCEFKPDPDQNGQPCSTGVCQDGTCASQCVPADCNDNDDCTDDVCDPQAGCQHPATDCDDGNDCTVDSCKSNGGCQHTGKSCNDGNECTKDSCNPSTGECTTADADNGTTCGDNQVCLKGKCSTPYYVDDVQDILANRCSGCHSGPIGACRGGICLALCYDEAIKSPFNCRLEPQWTNGHDCLDHLMMDGLMPQAGIDCSADPGHVDGCPSQLEINIIDSWNMHNHPATSDNSTPPACPGL
jgi:slime mold repeat-containing protein